VPLDAELQPIVDLVNSLDAPAPSLEEVTTLRESFALMAAAGGSGSQDVEVEGLGVPGGAAPLAVRVYRPAAGAAAPAGNGRPGALLWLHGGGWVIGDLDTHDAVCRELCIRSGATIISVGYRLAPEHVFPAAHDDCWRALRWVVDHAAELEIDPNRLAVGGDSAGGHLATVLARRARDEGGPAIALQVLVYPVTDLRGDTDEAYRSDYPSKIDNAEGYVLTTETMAFFRSTYAPDPAVRSDPSASPIAVEDLSGLAPAFVLTAEFDPLRDEGEAYAARLAAAGVPTTSTRVDGAIHMFFQLTETAIGSKAIDDVAAELRRHLV